MSTIAADPNLKARLGITSVLHTWSSAPIHHPHVHTDERVSVQALADGVRLYVRLIRNAEGL
jgi:hypothetical protein